MGDEPIFYLKFTEKKEYAEDVENGQLFMHKVQYYRDLEKKMLKKGQGDSNELLQQFNLFNIQIINNETNKMFMSLPSAKATLEINGDADVFLFCMTGITIDDLEIVEYSDTSARLKLPFSQSDVENIKKDFGKFSVIINGIDFRNIINEEIEKKEVEAIFGKVIYCEQNVIQRIDSFRTLSAKRFLYKDTDFAYQKEYRLAVDSQYVTSNYFKIEPIKNICHTCTIEELIGYGFSIQYELVPIIGG